LTGNTATLILNRPNVHNAFHFEMLNEILDVFKSIDCNNVDILVIRGAGSSFCGGADIKWFSGLINLTEVELRNQLQSLSNVLWELYNHSVTTIAVLTGSVLGGGIGLSAACDYVVGEEDIKMAFREVKLGITPALISPFVINKIGSNNAKELMLFGNYFSGTEAQKLGLVSHLVKKNELETALNNLIKELQSGGIKARKSIKTLISGINMQNVNPEILGFALNNSISVIRSEEAKEGFLAFLEKRKPNWQKLREKE